MDHGGSVLYLVVTTSDKDIDEKPSLFSISPPAHATKWQLSEVQILLMPQVLSFVAAKLSVVKPEKWKIRHWQTHQKEIERNLKAKWMHGWNRMLLFVVPSHQNPI